MNQRVLSRLSSSMLDSPSLMSFVFGSLPIGYNAITVGQTKQARDLSSYVLPPSTELDMVFQFDLMHLGHPPMDKGGGQNALIWHPFSLKAIKDIVTRWQGYMRTEGYWNTFVPSPCAYWDLYSHVMSVQRLP
jgi:glycosidase